MRIKIFIFLLFFIQISFCEFDPLNNEIYSYNSGLITKGPLFGLDYNEGYNISSFIYGFYLEKPTLDYNSKIQYLYPFVGKSDIINMTAQNYADTISYLTNDYEMIYVKNYSYFKFSDEYYILNKSYYCDNFKKNIIFSIYDFYEDADFEFLSKSLCNQKIANDILEQYKIIYSKIQVDDVWINYVLRDFYNLENPLEHTFVSKFINNDGVEIAEYFDSENDLYFYYSMNSYNLFYVESIEALNKDSIYFDLFKYDISNTPIYESYFEDRGNEIIKNIIFILLIVFFSSFILSLFFEKLKSKSTFRRILVYSSLSSGFLLIFFSGFYFIKGFILLVIFLIILISYFLSLKKNSKELIIKPNHEISKMVTKICEEIKISPPEKIVLTPIDSISVTGVFNKKLIIGYLSINYLSKKEFESIIAHEMGHFKSNDLFVGNIIFSLLNLLNKSIMPVGLIFRILAPFGLLFFPLTIILILNMAFIFLIKLSSSVFSRLKEEDADMVAVNYSGKNIFCSALFKYSIYSDIFRNIFLRKIYVDFAKQKKANNIYFEFNKILNEKIKNLFKKFILNQKFQIFSSHPTIKTRIELFNVDINKISLKPPLNKIKFKHKTLVEKGLSELFYSYIKIKKINKKNEEL